MPKSCASTKGTSAIEGALVPRWQATCAQHGVSARVYYTTGTTASAVTAISDAKIVGISVGNQGD